ncbi:MAG: hypothetical protein AAF607_12310 [Pseudomonadota bacterium]
MSCDSRNVFERHAAMRQQLAIARQMVRKDRSLESLYVLSEQLRDISTVNCSVAEAIRETSIQTRRTVQDRVRAMRDAQNATDPHAANENTKNKSVA